MTSQGQVDTAAVADALSIAEGTDLTVAMLQILLQRREEQQSLGLVTIALGEAGLEVIHTIDTLQIDTSRIDVIIDQEVLVTPERRKKTISLKALSILPKEVIWVQT